MGSQQSKPMPYTEEKIQLITERLRALPANMSDHMEDDYVQVSKSDEKGSRAYRKATSMSVSKLERWQETLLQNPKNRSVQMFL